MANQVTELKGVVRGMTIELAQETGLSDGQKVMVIVLPAVESVASQSENLPGFGAWADEAEEVDAHLEWSRQQRKQERPDPDF